MLNSLFIFISTRPLKREVRIFESWLLIAEAKCAVDQRVAVLSPNFGVICATAGFEPRPSSFAGRNSSGFFSGYLSHSANRAHNLLKSDY